MTAAWVLASVASVAVYVGLVLAYRRLRNERQQVPQFRQAGDLDRHVSRMSDLAPFEERRRATEDSVSSTDTRFGDGSRIVELDDLVVEVDQAGRMSFNRSPTPEVPLERDVQRTYARLHDQASVTGMVWTFESEGR